MGLSNAGPMYAKLAAEEAEAYDAIALPQKEDTFQARLFELIDSSGKTDPETLDPGALGRILIDSFAKSGLPVMIRIYNPYDTPAAPADCLIIGVENNDGIIFSNGIRYDSGLEEYTALLGEPSGISGEVYFWCDENQAHIVNVQVKNGETSLLSYMNLTAVQKQLP